VLLFLGLTIIICRSYDWPYTRTDEKVRRQYMNSYILSRRYKNDNHSSQYVACCMCGIHVRDTCLDVHMSTCHDESYLCRYCHVCEHDFNEEVRLWVVLFLRNSFSI
jgi:hypothetical protein